ncbi:MAG: alpha-amylase family glycosyl hydrolase, partial [Bacteroidota bacterium]|nr:alpha-amylase family glycosyl hydrolase [Bacteroidota bacterium]
SVLTTNPIFPLHAGNVIISFDATLGNGALAGDTNNIYAHIGVITSESTNETDWQYIKTEWGENTSDTKFTKIGNDLYELSITHIRNYFGVPVEEEILQIALVIRSEEPIAQENPDDFIVARAVDGSDLYIDVYDDGLAVKITNPPKTNPLVELNSIIPVCSFAMGHTSFSIFIDDVFIKSSTSDTIIYGLNTNDYSPGMHSIVVEATDGTNNEKDSTHFFIREDVTLENLPVGIKNGINYINENTVTLVLEDPIYAKEYAFVIGGFNNWQIADSLFMKKTPDGKYFWLTISGLNSGKEYAYQYYIDGEIKIADPYSDKILDPWNDKYIPNYNYSSLKQYPFNLTKGIVSVLQTGQTDYTWTINDFEPVANADSLSNLIIYELLIRDFVSTSAIKDVEKRLDYLQNLGINAIELMPFNEFEGNSSWGYNPSFYFATDKFYGKKNDYKHFIDECHKRGIAVIMDMVLNHSFGQSPLVQMYWNDVEKKPTANNPWYNQEATHPLSPGYDFNHESTHTKDFVKDVLEYWLTEYKIDGFRFDLSKGFTQTYSGSDINVWSAYDQSRINIWNDYYSFIKSINDKAYVILEHLGHNDEEVILANAGMLLWANMNEQYTQTSMGFSSNSDFSNSLYSNRDFAYPNLIAYMESHDEERIMYKNLTYGNSNGSYNIKDEENAINTAAGVAAFYLLFPGPKMIWQFGELGYDYSINFCQDGTINEDCRTSDKPIHWEYLNDIDRQQIFSVYQNLLKLKTSEEAFRTGTFTYDLSGTGKREWISSSEFNLLAIANFDVTSFSMTYNFQHTGTWYNLFDQTTLNVTDVNMSNTFEPGEFHIYTDKYYDLGTIPVKNKDLYNIKLNIYPNPANNYITIQSSENFNIEVYDLTGKKVDAFIKTTNSQTYDISKLNNGIYSFVFKNDKEVITKKVVINR